MISLRSFSRPLARSTLRIALAGLLMVGMAAAASPSDPKDKPAPGRTLTGKVLDKHDNPVVNSVVYLSNTRTHAVTSYIVGPDGSYQFPQLSPNVDYEVYAQYQGRKSDTKTVSQFDDRKQVNIVLRIDLK
ncbi:MAG TPA: carboxypeptidase-like regulatory domain-containing protein [Terriglobales bacterium]|nr:carboxypeptidase-like regulatory domain-containing protein [Terriglobales bacterium]